MATFDLVVDGVDFGEGPRWHDGRLSYSDFHQVADGLRFPNGSVITPDGGTLIVGESF